MNVLSGIPFEFDKSISDLIYNSTSTAKHDDDHFRLEPDNILIMDSYFSSFSLGKWKMDTELQSLVLRIDFVGDLTVKVRHIEPGEGVKDHQEFHITTDERKSYELDITDFPNLNGLFTLEVIAHQASEIYQLTWGTNQPVKNDINLAIVITTFNRQAAVTESINTILSGLDSRLNYHLYVIDNGSNLNLDIEDSRFTLMPNKNYGGAGGFSRGLHEAINNAFTHCLFMDDDASCLTESIERSYHLLEHTTDKKLAVAGAMLSEEEPTLQHESGALFDGFCHPLKHKLDLTDLGALVENERHENIDYAGWWFFMFPVAVVKEYAYPFFVRGDDSNFSMQHDFAIRTLNGVGSWQENFAFKSSPLTEYLDLRYHLVHRFHVDKLSDSREDILAIFWKFFNKNNNKYLYETAEACCMAFEDFMKGPDFFENNLDASEVRKKIGAIRKVELQHGFDEDESRQDFDYHYLGGFWKYARKLTLNGHLLPEFMLDKSLRHVNKEYPPIRAIFLAKDVQYVFPEANSGFHVSQSKRKYFENLKKAAILTSRYALIHKKLRQEYQDSYKKMTSVSAWEKRFSS